MFIMLMLNFRSTGNRLVNMWVKVHAVSKHWTADLLSTTICGNRKNSNMVMCVEIWQITIILVWINTQVFAWSLKSRDWNIYSFHINTTVTSRYAMTVITSRVVNVRENSTEIHFHVKIPKTAFISKFRMCVFLTDMVCHFILQY